MKRDSRLSGVLHILLHMAEHAEPVTSEMLANAMDTNPVVVRRTMAGLRKLGYVRSTKGHGGGWTLARELSSLTMYDIYEALGSPALIAMSHRSDSPDCMVENAVNVALGQAFEDAAALLLARLKEVSLAMLSETIRSQSPAAEVPDLNTAHTEGYA